MISHRTEEEVDEMIEKMTKRTKGKYITQGVSFNKTCPRQMSLLKKALLASASFSGLAKEALAIILNERVNYSPSQVTNHEMAQRVDNRPDSIPQSKLNKNNAKNYL